LTEKLNGVWQNDFARENGGIRAVLLRN
jgi:hypothetical protein